MAMTRAVIFDMDGLLVVGRGVFVPQDEKVGKSPVAQPNQVEVEIEPPTWVLVPEEQHQQRGHGVSSACSPGC